MFLNNKWILIFLCSLLLFVSSTKTTFQELDLEDYNLKTAGRLQNISSSSSQITLTQLQDFVKRNLTTSDPMGSLYREPATQWLVRDYLKTKINSDEIIDTVLLYSTQKKLPIKIVFSLVFVESSYSLTAVNYNKNATKDFGLFQLNSKTFSYLDKDDFFHLDTNVDKGTSYLAYAFSLDPDPRVALAIYNAGPGRPLRGQTPESTKKYVKKILTQSNNMQNDFIYYVWKKLDLSSYQGDV